MPTRQELLYDVRVNDSQLDALIAKTARLNQTLYSSTAAMKPLDAQLRGMGRRTVEIGRYMTRNFTQPMLLGAAAVAKLGYDFQKQLTQIQTLGGAGAESMDSLRKSLTDLSSSQRTQGLTKLADALYFIRSSGFSAKEGVEALKASNTGFRVGLGETKDVADTITTVMNAYGHANISAAHTVDILTATVRTGKAEPAALASSIGRVIPLAKQMGVSFDQVGGAIAALTLQGLSADLAVTGLRATFTTLTRGQPAVQKGLAAIGLSIDGVQKSIRTSGLAPTLNTIRQRVDEFDKSGGKLARNTLKILQQQGAGAAKQFLRLRAATGDTAASLLSQLFPNVRALNAFLILTNNHGKQTARTMGQVKDSFGDAAAAAKLADAQPWAQLQKAATQALDEVRTAGESLLKPLARLVGAVTFLFRGFNRLPGPIKELIALNAVLLAAVGPVLVGIGQLIRLSSAYVLRRGIASKTVQGAYAAEGAAAQESGAAAVKASQQAVVGADLATAAYERELVAVRLLAAEQAKAARIASLAQTGTTLFGGGVPLYRRGTFEGQGPGRVGTVRPGFTGPGGAPILFKNIRPEMEAQMTLATRMKGAVRGVGGAFVGMGAAARAAGLSIRAALAPLWPLLAIELVTELALHWDSVSKAIVRAADAVSGFKDRMKEAIPGGGKGLIEMITGKDPLGGIKSFLDKHDLGGSLIEIARGHQEDLKKKTEGTAGAAKKERDYRAEIARITKASAAELNRVLHLTQGTGAAAQKAAAAFKTAFENAFGRISDDLGTAFDAATDKILTRFDATTERLVQRMRVTVTVMGRTFTMRPGDKTPAERELAALEKSNELLQARRALLEGGRDLATAMLIGDPAGVEEAQRQIADARTQIRQSNLRDRADRERAAVDKAADRREAQIRARRARERREIEATRNLEKRHLQDQLAALENQLEHRRITIGQFNTRLRALMGKFGVTASDGAKLIGKSFGQQISEDLNKLDVTIRNHADYFARQAHKMAAAANAVSGAVRGITAATSGLKAPGGRQLLPGAVGGPGAIGGGGRPRGGGSPTGAPGSGLLPRTGPGGAAWLPGTMPQRTGVYGIKWVGRYSQIASGFRGKIASAVHAAAGSVIYITGGSGRSAFGYAYLGLPPRWVPLGSVPNLRRYGLRGVAGEPLHVRDAVTTAAATTTRSGPDRTMGLGGHAFRASGAMSVGGVVGMRSLAGTAGVASGAGTTQGYAPGGRLPGIGSLPKWLQPEARGTIKMLARKMVRFDQLSWALAHGQHVSMRQLRATLPQSLSKSLSAAQKRRLGPEGTANYLQWLAQVQSAPIQGKLVAPHAGDRPFTLGAAGRTGDVRPITINIYESGNPRRTAAQVRNVLQKQAARNSKRPRGKHANERIGAG